MGAMWRGARLLGSLSLLWALGCDATVLPEPDPLARARLPLTLDAAVADSSSLGQEGDVVSPDVVLADGSVPEVAAPEASVLDASQILYGADGAVVFAGNYPDLTAAVNAAAIANANLSGAQFALGIFAHDALTLQNGSSNPAIDGGLQLPGSNWTSSYAPGPSAVGVNFIGANLSHARWFGANLTGAHLENATLRNLDINGGQASFAVFRGADLTGANFHGADVECCDFRGALGLTTVDWGESDPGGSLFDPNAFGDAGNCPPSFSTCASGPDASPPCLTPN